MEPVGVVVAGVAGLVLGWFVGPVADRVATPRYGPDSADHDPEDTALALLDAPTSARARAVAAVAVGVAWALLAAEFADLDVWALFAVLVLAYAVAALIDLQYLRLPDVITWPAAAAAAVGALLVAPETEGAVVGIAASLGAAAFLLGFSILFRMVRGREAFGLGDVKLLLSLGASAGWLGWTDIAPVLGPIALVVWVLLAGFVIGALGGVPAAGFKVSKHVPFGPFLMVGWLAVVLVADSLR